MYSQRGMTPLNPINMQKNKIRNIFILLLLYFFPREISFKIFYQKCRYDFEINKTILNLGFKVYTKKKKDIRDKFYAQEKIPKKFCLIIEYCLAFPFNNN